jgi:hemolysin activation/secretion protein
LVRAALLLAATGTVSGLFATTAHAQGASAPAPQQQQSAEDLRFDILEFVVQGDTVLGAAAIERAVYPFLGPQRTLADAEGARKALERAYQDAGFLSVNVVLPEQSVGQGGGELRLLVVASAVDRLRVTGAQYTLPSRLREALPSLAAGRVPNFQEMQEELAQVARASTSREVTPIIAAGERPDLMSVELKVQERLPLQASVELNNKRAPNTRAGRLEAAVEYNDLFQRGHSVGLSWTYSPSRPAEANIQTLNYHLPLGGPGDRLYLAYVHSDSNTPTPLGGATVSRGSTWRLRWRDELRSLEGLSHAMTWGVTLRDLRDANINVGGISTASPPLRYQTFQVGYELDLSGGGGGDGATQRRSTRLQADLTLGLSSTGRRTVDCFGQALDQFACKRSAAEPGFQTLGLALSHREPLGRWSLDVGVQAQLADAPLVPAEQVVYGGMDTVRGYDEGEQAGDLGAALRMEITTPSWQPLDSGWVLRGQGFYDAAVLRRLQALPAEVARTSLSSAGLGVLLQSSFGLQASLHWARILQAPRGQRWEFTLRQPF